MREHLEKLLRRIAYIDTDNLYQAVAEIRQVLEDIVEQLDIALPKDVSDDI